jgi:hypothetical protein
MMRRSGVNGDDAWQVTETGSGVAAQHEPAGLGCVRGNNQVMRAMRDAGLTDVGEQPAIVRCRHTGVIQHVDHRHDRGERPRSFRGALRRIRQLDPGAVLSDRDGHDGELILIQGRPVDGPAFVFSDWSAGEVLAVDLGGHSEVIAELKSLPLCTAWLPDGRLLIVSSPDGLLLRREPDGSLVTHADLGRPGWNDIVVDGRSNAYVNRAGFDPVVRGAVRAGIRLPRRGGRLGAPGGRRCRLPERDGGDQR